MLRLNVTASGPGKDHFTYQWKRMGSTSLASVASRNPNFEIKSVTPSDSGSYYCVVLNQWGNMRSSNKATVNVLCK